MINKYTERILTTCFPPLNLIQIMFLAISVKIKHQTLSINMTETTIIDLLSISLLVSVCLRMALGEKLHVLIGETVTDVHSPSRHIQMTNDGGVILFVKNAANQM